MPAEVNNNIKISYSYHDTVCTFGKINKGDYYIIPSTFDRGKQGKFFLTIYTDSNKTVIEDSDIVAEEEQLYVRFHS